MFQHVDAVTFKRCIAFDHNEWWILKYNQWLDKTNTAELYTRANKRDTDVSMGILYLLNYVTKHNIAE